MHQETRIQVSVEGGTLIYIINKEGITHIFTDSEGNSITYEAFHENVIEAIKELQWSMTIHILILVEEY